MILERERFVFFFNEERKKMVFFFFLNVDHFLFVCLRSLLNLLNIVSVLCFGFSTVRRVGSQLPNRA